MPLINLPDNPFDHNAECRFCDEQAGHAGDCPWLEGIFRERQELKEAVRDYAAKLQLLINTMDERGQLPEHVFTFPDGDSWEAKR